MRAPPLLRVGAVGQDGELRRPCHAEKTLAKSHPPGKVSCMLAKLNTFALMGIDALPVETEVDCSDGLPKTVLVGLPGRPSRRTEHLSNGSDLFCPPWLLCSCKTVGAIAA